ncbi:MAG TPA: DUF1538 domain-containing protein [Methanofollis liminatans]|uniref:DUF1538 domain-containing protein n=1 Tax=Methanofollis liminatans TaxID=2201 RepID=A0A831PMA4_9EURY|nr:DUF1538 domain-containing protein [Methanofollis liminatans]
MQDYKETFQEVLQAILPIGIVILLFQVFVLGASVSAVLEFLLGAAMVVFGIALFLIGVRIGLLPMGEAIGSEMPKSGSLLIIAAVAFFFGFLTTVAEPDVRVLTTMIDSVSGGGIAQTPMILVIAVGVGFFVATALLRIIYRIPIMHLLAAGYGAVILLSLVTPPEYIPIAFDAGGVTTGPITVPFILALGIGVTSVLGGRSALSDGFGLIGLASIGPILGVMLMGVVMAL